MNFGPEFWCPPSDLSTHGHHGLKEEEMDMDVPSPKKKSGKSKAAARKDPATQQQHKQGKNGRLRPMGHRYAEQIAEDVLYDLIDEVDFWALDAAEGEGTDIVGAPVAEKGRATSVVAELETAAGLSMDGIGVGLGEERAVLGGGVLGGGGGEIKEIVQEEE